MRISEVYITPIKDTNGHVAFASCVIDGSIFVGSIGVHKLLDGTGYRLTYPAKKIGDRMLNYYHPITRDAGREIEEAIYQKCKEIFERSDEQHGRHNQTTNTYS